MGVMKTQSDRRGSAASGALRILLALACVLLVLVSATVQVAHTHADGNVSHNDCSLCATAHVVAEEAQTPAPAPAIAVAAAVERFLPLPACSSIAVFALFTRPPPIVDIVPA